MPLVVWMALREKHLFLSKCEAWPIGPVGTLKCELGEIVNKEWQDFLSLFKVENLNYVAIDITEIMDWYFQATCSIWGWKIVEQN